MAKDIRKRRMRTYMSETIHTEQSEGQKRLYKGQNSRRDVKRRRDSDRQRLQA